MSNSPNLYLSDACLYDLETKVVDSITLQFGGFAVAAERTIFRPNGGGQPDDHGFAEINGGKYRVHGLHKDNGRVYLHLPNLERKPATGTKVVQHVSPIRREAVSKLHTLQHLMSAASTRLVPTATLTSSGISDDALQAWIELSSSNEIDLEPLHQVDRQVRCWVLGDHAVHIERHRSIDHAKHSHPEIFRLAEGVKLNGKVRLIVIDGIDANACSGTHHGSSNVGPYGVCIARALSSGQHTATLTVSLASCWQYWWSDRLKIERVHLPSK